MTSFHHQPEAQHPKSSAVHKIAGRLPHLLPQERPNRGQVAKDEKGPLTDISQGPPLNSVSSNAVVMRSRRRKHSLAIANSVPYASDGHL